MSDGVRLTVAFAASTGIGIGVVRAVGLPMTGRWTATTLALAPLAGVLVCGLVAVATAVAGVGVRLVVVLPLAALLALVALRSGVGARLSPWPMREASPRRSARLLEIGLLSVFGVLSLALVRTFVVTPLAAWDGWAIWATRAHALHVERDVWGPVLGDTTYLGFLQGYPVLYPALEAMSADAVGRFDPGLIHAVPAFVLIGFGLATWGVLRTVLPGWFAASVALVATGHPALVSNFRDNYVDGPLAVAMAVGIALLVIWLRRPAGTSALALGAGFLAAAGLMKPEGTLFVVAAVIAAVGVRFVSRRPLRPVLVAGLAALAPCTAWLVFVRARGFDSGPYEPSRLVDFDFLAAEGGRFTRAAGWMLSALVDDWLVAVVLFGCAAAIALTSRRYQGSLFLLVWAWLSYVGLATTYLVSRTDIDWHLRTSADRVVMTIGLAALVSVPILVMDALTERGDAGPVPGS